MTAQEDKYWTLANVVTGFVVLQAIGFLYTLSDHNKFIYIAKAKDVLIWPGILASVAYIGAVIFCYVAAGQWRAPDRRNWVYFWTMIGQVLIVSSNSFGVVLFAKWVFENTDPVSYLPG